MDTQILKLAWSDVPLVFASSCLWEDCCLLFCLFVVSNILLLIFCVVCFGCVSPVSCVLCPVCCVLCPVFPVVPVSLDGSVLIPLSGFADVY